MRRNPHRPDLLQKLLDGEAPPAEVADLSRHLEGCSECRQVLDEFRQVDEALAGEPLPALPPGFAARVVATSVGARSQPLDLWWTAFPRAWRIALAAALPAAALVGIVLGRAMAPSPPAPAPVDELVIALDHPVLAALSQADPGGEDRP